MKFDNNDVILAQQNNKEAFSRLYESIYKDLYKLAFYILGNHEIAEDVVSDTILDAYKSISNLKNTTSFEHWIIKILTNKCKKTMGYKYNSFTVFNYKARVLEDIDASTTMDFAEKSDVQKALEKISTQDRMIISLCIMAGYKSNEVAEILSMKPGTVRSRLNRALTKMKNYLEVK